MEATGPDAAADGPVFGTDGAPAAGGCVDGAKLVYVISEDDVLYSFFPPTLTFTRVGGLSCGEPSASAFSMSVDRQAVAWVEFTGGKLYKVSTSNASCTPTTFAPGQSGFTRFGMGFSKDVGGGPDAETLFICGQPGLARLDTQSLKVSRIGDVTGVTDQGCELTGTGDGRLYGLLHGNPASVVGLEKQTAQTLSTKALSGVSTGDSFAFAFWGGDFWLFSATSNNPSNPTSNVTQYRPSDGSTQVVKSNIGFRIVGAGVSTCAPITPK